MTTIIAIGLICLASIPREDCTRLNAHDYVTAGPVTSDAQCQFRAMIALAQHPGEWPEGSYPKLTCIKRTELGNVG